MSIEGNLFEEKTPTDNSQQPPNGVAPPMEGQPPVPAQEPVKAPEVNDLFADQLKSITNTDGLPKYDSVEKALEALGHSQTHITSLTAQKKALEQQLEELKAQAEKYETVEDVVERLTAMNESRSQETPKPEGLDADKVQELVQKALNESREQERLSANAASVERELINKFGDKARDVVVAKAQELGIDVAQFKALSSNNPKMVLALFNQNSGPVVNPVTNSFNMHSGQPKEEKVGRPAKSLLSGASGREQADYMRQIRDEVYREHDITT